MPSSETNAPPPDRDTGPKAPEAAAGFRGREGAREAGRTLSDHGLALERANAHEAYLLGAGPLVALTAGTLLVASLFFVFVPGSLWVPALANAGGAVLLLGAGLRSARVVAAWRRRARNLPQPTRPAWQRLLLTDRPPDEADGALERAFGRLAEGVRAGARRLGVDALALGGVGVASLLAVVLAWRELPPVPPDRAAALVVGGLLAATGFCLLVMERRFAFVSAHEWPEAPALARLCRIPVATLLIEAAALAFSQAPAARSLAVLAGVLPAAAAAEFALRAAAALFAPRREAGEPRFLAHSAVAGLLVWPPRPFAGVEAALRERLGIDLRQVWAFSFMRRAAPWVAVAVCLVGWLCSGIQPVPIDGRAIYERFGKPVAVLGPGLHLGLPWPVGRAVAVENGVVHEVPIDPRTRAQSVETAPAEGPAPPVADRLWDVLHESEATQVIAGEAGDRQSFQIVSMDVRFVYRIGLSDRAAMEAAYNDADPAALIRSVAGQALVGELAVRTLDGVLGERRAELAGRIGTRVQAQLDRLHAGVEILATVIEAIHPPAGAADAYHGVQAAEIGAQALVSVERGNAAATANDAGRLKAQALAGAAAAASETLAAARNTAGRFAAERRAQAEGGAAFLFERYLDALNRGLARAGTTILDRRIGTAGGAPTLDLRSFALPPDPPAGKGASIGPKEGSP